MYPNGSRWSRGTLKRVPSGDVAWTSRNENCRDAKKVTEVRAVAEENAIVMLVEASFARTKEVARILCWSQRMVCDQRSVPGVLSDPTCREVEHDPVQSSEIVARFPESRHVAPFQLGRS